MLQALQRASAAPAASLALLFIEVAEVARLQARIGFAVTTALLQSLQERLVDALGERGHMIWLGDGRFCAIVGAIRNSGHAVLAGEKLARVTEEVFETGNLALKPALHIGIALYPSHAQQPDALVRRAQLAAEASRTRGVRVVVFDEPCGTEVMTPWELGAEFAHAFATGELSVYYQPKIAVANGRPSGIEALMRWIRDGKTVATPDRFIPLAEEAGLIYGTTWYSLSNALRTAIEYDDLSLAVNITPGMLHHREFMNMMRAAVNTWSVAGSRLTLEVTEGALIADFNEATLRLNKLRDMGLRVSIDDFGTGYSSLSYFKKIPADEIKIDKSFVLGMATDAADRHLVSTIIGLSRHFHLVVVAEGVEDWQTFDALAEMGCEYVQGFLFSPALSGGDLKTWLQTNRGDLRLGHRG